MLEETINNPEQPSPPPPDLPLQRSHPLPNNSHLGDMIVQRYLGCSGNFHAYCVVAKNDDSQLYVAKVVRYPELLKTASRELKALNGLKHRNIVEACDVRVRPEAPYHLLEVYVQGETVRDIVAEKGRQAPRVVAHWASQLADALQYMETRTPPIYHGDISPRNIIITKSEDGDDAGVPKLIDFGLAYVDVPEREQGVVGTHFYRPPERDAAGQPWPASGDVYSLGVVLAEMLLGELPFESSAGEFRKDNVRVDALRAVPGISKEFAAVIVRAIAYDPDKRFHDAAEFLDALSQVPELAGEETTSQLESVINPYVSDLLRLYSRGPCNAENRGMDTEFAWQTYVPTELDIQLLPDILDRRYSLVILTGNPGDGKTAFLQQLYRRLAPDAATAPMHHWECETPDGWVFECVLDGSASDAGRQLQSSNEVLDALFQPFRRRGQASDPTVDLRRTQLVAINDGRLLEYLEECDQDDWVAIQARTLLGETDGTPHPRAILVDLNERSLLSPAPMRQDGDDFFTRLMSVLIDGQGEGTEDPWEICKTCRAQERCHVFYNVSAFRDEDCGHEVRNRIRTLLQLVHSRGSLHLTIRELRSSLAYLLVGTMQCEDIHTKLENIAETDDQHSWLTASPYWEKLFTAGEQAGPLFAQLQDLDPARRNNPQLDRTLSSAVRDQQRTAELLTRPHSARVLQSLLSEAPDHNRRQDTRRATKKKLAATRRLLIFEGKHECIESATGRKRENAWLDLLPYRSARLWLKHLAGEPAASLDDLRDMLCRAITRTDNVPPGVPDDKLAVRTTHDTRSDLVILRLYDVADFQASWQRPHRDQAFLNHFPRALLLGYGAQGEPTLEIPLDLFEVLYRFAAGFHLGAGELEAVAANLQIFKNRLLALTANEVCLLHPTHGNYRARQEKVGPRQQIILEAF